MMKSKKQVLRGLKSSAVFGIAALSASCASLLIPDPAPANVVYRLTASAQGEAVVPNKDALVIRVDRPTVPKPLSGDGITVSQDGDQILTASGAQWAERVPELIQGSIFDILSTRSEIIGVLPVSGARTELRIHLNVRNFEAAYDQGQKQPPLAVVRYTATLSNASDRHLIGSFDVRETQRASDNRVSAIVKAQDLANAAAINAIADWILTQDVKSAAPRYN